MTDFDPTVALQARGYNAQDAVAPLQAYLLAQEGRNQGAEAAGRDIADQGSQLALLSKQSYADSLKKPGANQLASLTASGLPAYDPVAAQTALGNIQSTNTLGALDTYSKRTNNPLGLIGPAAVGEDATAQNIQAQTQGVDQDTEAKRSNLRGQIGMGYLQNPTEAGWHAAVGAAKNAGLINDLQVYSGLNHVTDAGQRLVIAKQWAAQGAGSVQTSGIAAGNVARETSMNEFQKTVPGETISAPPPLLKAISGGGPPPPGFANPTPIAGGVAPSPAGTGRSVATDGPVPVGPAAPPLSQPIAQGYDSGAAIQAAQAGRWHDQATPAQMRQPPMMTQAEASYGLPTGYLARTAQIESGGDPSKRNAGSGAAGMFQFIPSTWARYGDPGTSPLNPQASTIAAARLGADNAQQMSRVLGRPPTAAELYLAHQQGAAGAAGLLTNPNAPASAIVGARAVISNGGTPNMTAGQFTSMWERKFNGQSGGNFSLSGPSPMGPGVSMPAVPSPVSLPGAGGMGVGMRAAAAPSQPDLAPPIAPSPIPLPSSTQPMPTLSADTMGRSASGPAPLPPTRQLPQGLTPVMSGMSPFQLEKQKLDAVRAVEEEKSARDQFVTANDAQRGLMQLSEDLTKLDPSKMQNLRDTFLSQGAGAETRIGLAKAVNTALATAGMAPLFDQEKIAAAESAAKTTGRLGFDLAGGLGKGEAGFVVSQAIGLNPSILNTPQGSKLLIGSLMAAQQRQKDLYLFQGEYARSNGGNPIGAEAMFDENRPPMTYVQDAQRLARVPLPAVKYLQAHGHDQGVITEFNDHYGPSLARYYLGSRTD